MSSSPLEPASPLYQRLVHKIILGGPDRQEAEGVEEGQEAKPEEDKRKVLEFLVFPVPLLPSLAGASSLLLPLPLIFLPASP